MDNLDTSISGKLTEGWQAFLNSLQPRAERILLGSPLEERFIERLEKYLSPHVRIIPQYQINTIVGSYRLDFVLAVDSRKIAFECDGKDFHDEWRDEWRDAMILGTGDINTIYRFKGCDIHTFLDDCIYLIYHFDKGLFNERYPILALRLISDEVQEQVVDNMERWREHLTVVYKRWGSEDYSDAMQLSVERRDKDHPGHWQVLLNEAKENPGKTLAELMKIRESKFW